MMFSYLLLFSTIYLVCSFNLACLTYLIQEGYFDNKFWTRSLRASFVAPPFAIIIFMTIFFKDSLKLNWGNIKIVMKKRED